MTDQRGHEACHELIRSWPGELIVPMLTVSEIGWHVRAELDSYHEAMVLESLAEGVLVEPVAREDWQRIADLVEQYGERQLGTVDASIVACAERLGIKAIATLDRRDFAAVKPLHVEAFDIYP